MTPTEQETCRAVLREIFGFVEWDTESDYEGEETCFTFWGDDSASIYRPEDDGDVSDYWNPFESMSDAFMVVEHLRATKQAVFRLEIRRDRAVASFGLQSAAANGDNPARAIMEAALRYVRDV